MCANSGKAFGEVSFDYSKCFDSLPRTRLLNLARKKGLDPLLCDSVRSLWDTSERHVIWRGAISDGISGPKGLPQGSAISVALAALWAGEWMRQIKSLVSQDVLLIGYLDDFSASCLRAEDMRRVVGFTEAFSQNWGIKLNRGKSALVISKIAGETWDLEGCEVPHLGFYDFLGLPLGHNKESARSARRLQKASERLSKIEQFSGSLGTKIRLVRSMVISVMYGMSFEKRHSEAVHKLSRRVGAALWGTSRFSANRDWVWASCLPASCCPTSWWWLELACLIWRIAQRQEGRNLLAQLWCQNNNPEDGVWSCFCDFLAGVRGDSLRGSACFCG